MHHDISPCTTIYTMQNYMTSPKAEKFPKLLLAKNPAPHIHGNSLQAKDIVPHIAFSLFWQFCLWNGRNRINLFFGQILGRQRKNPCLEDVATGLVVHLLGTVEHVDRHANGPRHRIKRYARAKSSRSTCRDPSLSRSCRCLLGLGVLLPLPGAGFGSRWYST